jgi:peptide-methionine (S)-S-oxide reductase
MTLTLAGGCFWCTEAVFKRLRGVSAVVPGYTGGTVPNPTYQQVCEGTTGHAEAIQITYDPSIIAPNVLLEVFFQLHDPTSLNRQGADTGTQYRSAIFYQSEEEKAGVETFMSELNARGTYADPIVTTLEPLGDFYEADESHRDYYARNSSQGYCQYVIDPKIQKLLKMYRPLIKEDYVSPRS